MRLYTVEDVDWDALPHDTARAGLARYLTGEPIEQVAADLGFSTHAIAAWLNRSRKGPRRSDAKPIPRDVLRSLLMDGLSTYQIGQQQGCSGIHVHNEISRQGLSSLRACQVALGRTQRQRARDDAADAKRQARRERDARIVAEYKAGDSIYVLADRHHLDPTGVWRVLRRDGVDTSQRTRRYNNTGRPTSPERVA